MMNEMCATFGTHMLCDDDGGFTCEDEGGFARREGEQLPARRRRRRRPGDAPYACDFCGATFKGRYRLTEHRRRHTGERAYPCADCDKTFVHCSGLSRHRRAHHGRPEDQARFACDVCGKRFRLRDSLTAHYGLHAGNNKARRGSRYRLVNPTA